MPDLCPIRTPGPKDEEVRGFAPGSGLRLVERKVASLKGGVSYGSGLAIGPLPRWVLGKDAQTIPITMGTIIRVEYRLGSDK